MLPCSELKMHRFHKSDQTGSRRKDVWLDEIEGGNNLVFLLEDILNAVWYENTGFKITSMHCNVWLAFLQRFRRDSASLKSSLLQ